MAWIVGTMLLILCVVAIPLQYAAGEPALADVVAPLHGVLYIVYLISVALLWRHARLATAEVVGLVCAGFVPGLAFYVEHRTSRRILPRRTDRPAGVPTLSSDDSVS